MSKSRILLLHAYAVSMLNGQEKLGPFMASTLEHAISVHWAYDFIVCLGGWHSKDMGPERLLGDVARDVLHSRRVPHSKVLTMRDFNLNKHVSPGMRYCPPRSTEEEIEMARRMLDDIEHASHIDACMVDTFVPKGLWYYSKVGLTLSGIQPVSVLRTPEDHLRDSRAILDSLVAMESDLSNYFASRKEHLGNRTLASGYEHPDPASLFQKTNSPQ